MKNYRKLTCIIIGIIILLPSLAMMVLRPHYTHQQHEQDTFPYSYRDISEYLVEAAYVLHAEEVQGESDTSLTPYEIFVSQTLPEEAASAEAPAPSLSVSGFGLLLHSPMPDNNEMAGRSRWTVQNARSPRSLPTLLC